MTDKTSARIAVIADTSLQRHVLQQALAGGGYQVVLNSDPARLDEEQLAACETDLWLAIWLSRKIRRWSTACSSVPVPRCCSARACARASLGELPTLGAQPVRQTQASGR